MKLAFSDCLDHARQMTPQLRTSISGCGGHTKINENDPITDINEAFQYPYLTGTMPLRSRELA